MNRVCRPMPPFCFVIFFAFACALVFSTVSCVQEMGVDGHFRPLDKRNTPLKFMREAPEGTVFQAPAAAQTAVSNPPPVTRALLEQGRDLFNANCVPCHGVGGYGNGMVVQRGFLAPPSYHDDRLRSLPDQHFYDVITNGYGAMYSYADRLLPAERWAVITYIRILQKSQWTPVGSLSSKEKAELQ